MQQLDSAASDFLSGALSDVTLQVCGKEYHCHRILLCRRSGLFLDVFANDEKCRSVQLEDVLPKEDQETVGITFPQVLQYIYTGVSLLHEGNGLHILKTATLCKIGSLKDQCMQFVRSLQKHSAVIKLCKLAEHLAIKEVEEVLMYHILRKFGEISEDAQYSEALCSQLSMKQFQILIESDELNADSEYQVFRITQRFMDAHDADSETRQVFYSAIRWHLFSATELLLAQEDEEVSKEVLLEVYGQKLLLLENPESQWSWKTYKNFDSGARCGELSVSSFMDEMLVLKVNLSKDMRERGKAAHTTKFKDKTGVIWRVGIMIEDDSESLSMFAINVSAVQYRTTISATLVNNINPLRSITRDLSSLGFAAKDFIALDALEKADCPFVDKDSNMVIKIHITVEPVTMAQPPVATQTISSKEPVPQAEQKSPDNTANESLLKFFKSAKFSDITVLFQDKEYRLHRVILACASQFFRSMFVEKNWKESAQEKIVIQFDHSVETLESIIHWMYTESLDLSMANALSILDGSEKYDIIGLREHCFLFLRSREGEQIFSMCKKATNLKLYEVQEFCLNRIAAHFAEYVDIPQRSWASLNESQMLSLVERSVLNTQGAEWKVYQTIVRYIKETRATDETASQLLAAVRYPLMEHQQIMDLESDQRVDRKYIIEALSYRLSLNGEVLTNRIVKYGEGCFQPRSDYGIGVFKLENIDLQRPIQNQKSTVFVDMNNCRWNLVIDFTREPEFLSILVEMSPPQGNASLWKFNTEVARCTLKVVNQRNPKEYLGKSFLFKYTDQPIVVGYSKFCEVSKVKKDYLLEGSLLFEAELGFDLPYSISFFQVKLCDIKMEAALIPTMNSELVVHILSKETIPDHCALLFKYSEERDVFINLRNYVETRFDVCSMTSDHQVVDQWPMAYWSSLRSSKAVQYILVMQRGTLSELDTATPIVHFDDH